MNDVIKTTELMMQDANSLLQQSIKAKDMNKVKVAQVLLETAHNSKLLCHKHIREKT